MHALKHLIGRTVMTVKTVVQEKYPGVIFPRVRNVYTIRDVVVLDGGKIAFYLNEITNYSTEKKPEIAFSKKLFRILDDDMMAEAQAVVDQLVEEAFDNPVTQDGEILLKLKPKRVKSKSQYTWKFTSSDKRWNIKGKTNEKWDSMPDEAIEAFNKLVDEFGTPPGDLKFVSPKN